MFNKVFYSLLSLLLIFNIFLFDQQVSFPKTDNLEITVLDIGQGDSLLIRTPKNNFGLIDTGKGNLILEELAKTTPFFTREFNFIILTHPDADHVEGFLNIVNKYDFKNIFFNKVPKDSSIYNEIIFRLKEINNTSNIYSLTDLNDFELDDVTFDVLWPQRIDLTSFEEDVNESSIALMINYKKFTMYSAGDLGEINEVKSLQGLSDKSIDVLKVSHHGSTTSTSIEFLALTKPKIAAISVGKNNSYKHPTQETLDELSSSNAIIYRTDIEGRIKIDSNGDNLRINTAAGNVLEISAE